MARNVFAFVCVGVCVCVCVRVRNLSLASMLIEVKKLDSQRVNFFGYHDEASPTPSGHVLTISRQVSVIQQETQRFCFWEYEETLNIDMGIPLQNKRTLINALKVLKNCNKDTDKIFQIVAFLNAVSVYKCIEILKYSI
jgi:hypothetical protein